MIELTIRTLDAGDHPISVEDELTVGELKERIRDQIGIPLHLQRLIFCGRVLIDDRQLSDFDLNGKVIHLVPRPPPSPLSRNYPTSRGTRQQLQNAFDAAQHPAHRVPNRSGQSNLFEARSRSVGDLMNDYLDPPSELVEDQQRLLSMTPSSRRLEFVRRLIEDMDHLLRCLRNLWLEGSLDDLSIPLEEMEMDSPPSSPDRAAPTSGFLFTGLSPEVNRVYGSQRAPRSIIVPGPQTLATQVEELNRVQTRLAPFLRQYLVILRERNINQLDDERREHRLAVVQLVSELMHSLSHAYHAISDLTLEFGDYFPRLATGNSMNLDSRMQGRVNTSARSYFDGDYTPNSSNATRRQPVVNQFSTGGPASTPLRRPNGRDNSGASTSTAGIFTSTSVDSANDASMMPGTSSERRYISLPTPEIAPDAVTYQVEIETRVPIDTAFFNGLAAAAANNIQGHQGQQTQETPRGQSQPMLARRNQPNTNPSPPQQRQQAPEQFHRPVFVDIETLLRPLSEVYPAVEVVMSSEETHDLDGPETDPVNVQSVRINGPAINVVQGMQNPANSTLQFRHGSTGAGENASATARTRAIPPTIYTIGPPVSIANIFGAQATTTRNTNTQPAAQANANITPGDSTPAAGTHIPPHLGRMHVPFTISPHTAGVATFSYSPINSVSSVSTDSQFSAGLGMHTDSGVFVAPMSQESGVNPNEFLRYVFPSMFRQQTNTSAISTSTNSATTHTVTSSTASTHTVTSQSATVTNGSPITTATVTITTSPMNPSGSGRTSDGMWGMGLTPNMFDNITNPTRRQNRLGPLSAMVRARTLQQAEQRRQNASETTSTDEEYNRPNNTSAHNVALCQLNYDDFNQCSSLHANRRLSERRRAYQHYRHDQLRQRNPSEFAEGIDHLRDHNVLFNMRHMSHMVRLLCASSSVESCFNAFFVILARALYMSPDEDFPVIYDPFLMPREYLSVRMKVQEYFRPMVATARAEATAARSSTDMIVNMILAQVNDFINNMGDITPIDPNADPITSLREFLQLRLPDILALTLSDSVSVVTMARFYLEYENFFTDLCALIMKFCTNGFQGLLELFTAFMSRVTVDFERTTRECIELLAREDLMAIRSVLTGSSTDDDFERYDGSDSGDCCLYQASLRSEEYRPSSRQMRYMPHICEHHQRQTMPITTPPLMPPPPRDDTPDAMDSLPSTSMPSTLSSSSPYYSESPQSPDQDEQYSDDSSNDESDMPKLEYDNEASDANSGSTESRNSLYDDLDCSSSPVEMRSAATSPGFQTTTPPPEQEAAQADEQPSTEEEEVDVERSSPSSPESTRFVPPVMILEHWGEEWVPVFTQDQRVQRERERPQEPHSDAYLSGMPSSKRRCVRASRLPATLDGFMNESAREVTDRAELLNTPNVRTVFRDSMRSLVRARAETSEDFDPERYAAAARFLEETAPAQNKEKDAEKVEKND